MAKFSTIPPNTTPAITDFLVAVTAAGVDEKIAISALAALLGTPTGWLPPSGTWTYLSATTVTVPAADAANISVGDKVMFTQTTVKYFYVIGKSGTTLTLTGGSDYTVANATIVTPYYSHSATPLGFPQWFNYTPVYTGYSVSPTATARFSITERVVVVQLNHTASGTSNSTSATITIPVTASASQTAWSAMSNGADNSAATAGGMLVSSGASVATLVKGAAGGGGNWTATGGKYLNGIFQYEI